jgi:hypothetical protein
VAVVLTGEVLHVYVYGVVPPEGVTLTEPLFIPLHNALLSVLAVAANKVGCVTVAVVVVVQLCASVTVTVYVPAARPVAIDVVCSGDVLQA